MKKIISIILAMLLLIGLMPMNVFAVDESDHQILGQGRPQEHNIMLPVQGELQFSAEERTVLGASSIVEKDGRVSSVIPDNSVIWIYEKSYDEGTWYGLDNRNGIFQPGSKFWVKEIDKNMDAMEFDENNAKFSSLNRLDINNSGKVLLFGVVDPDGNECIIPKERLNLYVQLGDDWDSSDIKALMAGGGKDEQLQLENVQLECPEGEGRFARLTLYHFGEPLMMFEEKPLTASVSSGGSGAIIASVAAAIVIAVVAIVLIKKKKQKDS